MGRSKDPEIAKLILGVEDSVSFETEPTRVPLAPLCWV